MPKIILIVWALLVMLSFFGQMSIAIPLCTKCITHIWGRPKINTVPGSTWGGAITVNQTWHKKCWRDR